MKLGRISLYLVAISFLSLGVIFLIWPATLTLLAEIPLPNPVAVIEVRGVYGGFFFGTGLFFLLFAREDAWIRPGLIAQISLMGGLVLGRTLGIILGGPPNHFLLILLVSEVIGLGVGVIALKQIGR